MTININERYLRHNLIDWFSQNAVSQAKIAVIGAGAIGNEVVKNLALLGVGCIDVFDFDYIEAHNLTKSILFRESDIGKSKAKCVVERASELDPNVKLRAFTGDFWDYLSVSDTATYCTVICCVDNFEARMKLNQLCILAGVDLINVAMDSKYVSVEIYPFSQGVSVPCYECGLPDTVYQRVAQRYSCGWLKKKSNVEKIIPTTIITSSLAGGYAVSLTMNRFGVASTTAEPMKALIDAKSMRTSISSLAKRKNCGGCSQYDVQPIVIRTQNNVKSFYQRNMADIEFISSDLIITKYQCKNGCVVDDEKYRLKLARNFDESIYLCPSCGSNSIDFQAKDQFASWELLDIFGDAKLPVKYLIAVINQQIVCFDLEEDKDERSKNRNQNSGSVKKSRSDNG